MHILRIGFFSPRQYSARTGRSGCGLPPRRTGRFGAAGTVPGLLPPFVVPFIVPGTPPASVPIAGAAAVLIAAVVAFNVVCHTPVDVTEAAAVEFRRRRKKFDVRLAALAPRSTAPPPDDGR